MTNMAEEVDADSTEDYIEALLMLQYNTRKV